MKRTSLLSGSGGQQGQVPELAWRWGAALFGRRRAAARHLTLRTLEFALDARSLWRIAGDLRGVRIECRRGRLWLTQAGAASDVILQPGQDFVAGPDGAIVVQPVFASADEIALGRVTLTGGAARLKFHPGLNAGAPARIGMDLSARERAASWEQLAFIVLWLCGLFSVGYCLQPVLWLP